MNAFLYAVMAKQTPEVTETVDCEIRYTEDMERLIDYQDRKGHFVRLFRVNHTMTGRERRLHAFTPSEEHLRPQVTEDIELWVLTNYRGKTLDKSLALFVPETPVNERNIDAIVESVKPHIQKRSRYGTFVRAVDWAVFQAYLTYQPGV